MTYTQNQTHQNYCECEFTIPIKLNVPITVNTQIKVNTVPIMKQKLPVFLEPNLLLEPQVTGKSPVCYPQEECEQSYLHSEDNMKSVDLK